MTDSGGSDDRPDDAGRRRDRTGREASDDRDAPPRRGEPEPAPALTDGPLRWYVNSRHPLVVASRDVLTSVLLVSMIGLTLFAVSGVWPPMVAIESGSMEPHMSKGDLVIVVDSERFASGYADDHGVVTRAAGDDLGHEQFGGSGSVVVYQPDGQDRTPIIHRTAFYVEEGENWVERADPEHLGRFDSCEDVPRNNCPAPHDGYITRGDANGAYDQIEGQSTVVRPQWIEGRAVARMPYLGCIRLALSPGPSC